MKKKNTFYQVGCAGKIIKFEETEDNRYLITLKGLSRFNLISEKITDHEYREANISWENFSKDLDLNDKSLNFSTLKATLKKYFKSKKIKANMDAIDTFNDYNFVDQITMICPLANHEKQLLNEKLKIKQNLEKLVIDTTISTVSKITDINLKKDELSNHVNKRVKSL